MNRLTRALVVLPVLISSQTLAATASRPILSLPVPVGASNLGVKSIVAGRPATLLLPGMPGPTSVSGGSGLPAGSEEVPSAATGAIAEMQRLDISSLQAIEPANGGDLIFLSQNGRYALKGELWDIWAKKRLKTIDDVRDAQTHVDLAGLKVGWGDLKPFHIGTGSKVVRVFLDPNCPYCHALLLQMGPYLKAHTDFSFDVFVVPLLGEDSQKKDRLLSCAVDPQAALDALVTHQGYDTLAQVDKCDLAPAQRRFITAHMLGVEGVPYLVSADGRIHEGIPDDLAAFLGGRAT